MRIGIFIGSVGSSVDLEGQVQQAVDAENDGFDSFWSAQVAGVDAIDPKKAVGPLGRNNNPAHVSQGIGFLAEGT
ncbi:MAG: hypothetical protein IIB88_10155, partial [Chloroflexi bacterium]|nr:hypothetical protein [Chloroflexota bacterium]